MVKKEEDETRYGIEGISFGLADGVICFLGLTIGVAEATNNTSMVIIAGIIGGLADAFGNSIGFYMSQSAERAVQIHETEEHGVITRVHSRREVVMSSFFSFIATIIALTILLFPFAFFDMTIATILTFIFGTILAFILGSYVGKLGKDNPYKMGFKYAVLAIVGAVISHFVGDLLSLYITIV